SVVVEPDETPVEEMVRVRSEEQSVLAVQPLLVVRVAPGLAVARAQVFLTSDSGNAAGALDLHDSLLEETLPAAGEHDRLARGVEEPGVRLDSAQLVFLPLNE